MGKLFKLIMDFAFSILEREIAGRSDRGDVEKAQALMKIADFHLARFNKSRDIEWQVNALLWTAILFVGGFLLEKYPIACLPIQCCWIVYYLIGIFIAVGHFLWLGKIQGSQDFDKIAYGRCRNEALKHVDSLEEIGEWKPEILEKTGLGWIFAASVVTLILSWTVIFLMLAKLEGPLNIANKSSAIIRVERATCDFDTNLYLEDITPLKLSPAESLFGSWASSIE